MAALILPSRRVVQPQGAVEIDWSNPLARNLRWAGAPSSANVTRTGTVSNIAAANGSAWSFTNVSSSRIGSKYTPPTTGPCTLLTLLDVRAHVTNAAYIALGDRTTIGANGVSGFQFFTFDGAAYSSTSIGTAASDGAAVIIGRHTGSQNLLNYRVLSGESTGFYTSSSASASPRSHAAQELTFGGQGENPTRVSDCLIYLGAFWARSLAEPEVAALVENPWQLFRPIQRRIWVSVVGGGGGVTGSLAATEAGSDTFASSGTVLVAGSLSITESGSDTFASTGTVTVAGSLNATESGADTFAANGSTTGGISGSINATEAGADTAALSGVVLVAGSLNATESGADTFSASGVVVVTGLLSATEAGQDTFAAVGFGGAITGSLNAQESGSDTFFATNVEQQTGGKGFEIVDMPSRQWWKRKPKAIPEQVAEQRVKRVVRAIQEVTQEQAAEPAKATQSAAQQQREVYEAIAPMLADMPGFDWKQVFRQIVEQDNARKQMQATIARARFIEQDDEDVLLLMF